MSTRRKMIEVKVAFWTDGLDEPKAACWSSGTVFLSTNRRHGISAKKVNFNTVSEIGPAIESVLAKAGVVVHPSVKARAYAQTRGRRGQRLTS